MNINKKYSVWHKYFILINYIYQRNKQLPSTGFCLLKMNFNSFILKHKNCGILRLASW